MNIQISNYEDYQEISRALNRKAYAKENEQLQMALKLAIRFKKQGKQDLASAILSMASKAFVMGEKVKTLKKERAI